MKPKLILDNPIVLREIKQTIVLTNFWIVLFVILSWYFDLLEENWPLWGCNAVHGLHLSNFRKMLFRSRISYVDTDLKKVSVFNHQIVCASPARQIAKPVFKLCLTSEFCHFTKFTESSNVGKWNKYSSFICVWVAENFWLVSPSSQLVLQNQVVGTYSFFKQLY